MELRDNLKEIRARCLDARDFTSEPSGEMR
jgi:hypothetical protein